MSHTNPMLAWYGPTVLDDLPNRMSLDPALETKAEDLAFRDGARAWWRPQRDGSWLRTDPTGWTRANRPERLEGVAPLPVGVASVHPSVGDEPIDDAPVKTDAPEGLARAVELVRQSYLSGGMVSTMAELVLSDWMLLTEDGRLWTVGAQSRSWYAYGDNGWEAQESPPDGPFITGPQTSTFAEAVDTPAGRWAEKGPYLPEAITPLWLVPTSPDGYVPPVQPAHPPVATEPAWIATHAVPAEGIQAWADPDPAGDVIANLAGRVELEVIERRANWANVKAENDWEAWVDGRRLIPILISVAASPATPTPASGDSKPATSASSALAVARGDPIPLIAAIALLISVFLPWFGGGAPWSFDLPAGFLWSFSADTGWFSIGLVMLVVGGVAVASFFVEGIAPYRRIVGGVAAAIAALWLVQTLRALLEFTDSGLAGIVADMFTDYLALGPWVALAAGITLIAKR